MIYTYRSFSKIYSLCATNRFYTENETKTIYGMIYDPFTKFYRTQNSTTCTKSNTVRPFRKSTHTYPYIWNIDIHAQTQCPQTIE